MSTAQETAEMLYSDLYRLLWAMVWDYANPDRWQLEPDEIFAELSAELVKVVYKYHGMPLDDMKRLVIVSMRHRCMDLAAMSYGTHRVAEQHIMDLDDVLQEPGVEVKRFDLGELYDNLSDDGGALVSEVLNPGDRMLDVLRLVTMRKEATTTKGQWTLSPQPYMLQRALGWDTARFQAAWGEVRMVLSTI